MALPPKGRGGALLLALLTLVALTTGLQAAPRRAAQRATVPARAPAPDGGACPAPTFASASYFAAGTNPQALAVGDFNHDGILDLAVANTNSSNVSLLRGTGSGGFGAPSNFGTRPNPQALAVGDFNRDGHLDLAAATSGTVGVLLGDGTGGFGTVNNFAVGSIASSVAVGDFNHDGNPDLVTATPVINRAAVLLGDGTGGFGPVSLFGVGSQPHSVAVADFDRDGHLDLVTANYGSANVSVLRGTGSGSFNAATNVALPTNPWFVTVADFDRDGSPDLVTANITGYNMSVLRGNGSGGFAPPVSFGANGSPYAVAVGDVNRDGNLDLVAVNNPNNNVAVLLGDGSGSFGPATTFGVGVSPWFVALGDFNGDSSPDLGVPNATSNNIAVLLNLCIPPPTATFPPTQTPGGPSATPVPTNTPSSSPTPSPLAPSPTNSPTRTPTRTVQPSPTPGCGLGWTLSTSPNVGHNSHHLWSVAAVTATDVWAVGSYFDNYTVRPLAEHWNGTRWTEILTPNLFGSWNSVAALATNDVWAVGDSNNDPVTVHWNGTAWVDVPNPPSGTSHLKGVAAVSTTDLWAVGDRISNSTIQTLIEHWDGTTWSIVTSPNVGSGDNQLTSVTALGATDLWAVGQYRNAGTWQTLIQHWDGTAWTVVPSPNGNSGTNFLTSVAGAGPNDVWAVGSFDAGVVQTLTLHWNGSAWQVVPSPNPGTMDNRLQSVAVVNATTVWAVGNADFRTLAEVWNGSTWTAVFSPNGTSDDELNGVTAVAADDLWAVGEVQDALRNGTVTLIEHYALTCAPPPPPPTPCVVNYTFSRATATIVPGTTDIGLHCDNCFRDVALPFPYQLYEQPATMISVDSNGRAVFPSGYTRLPTACLPDHAAYYTIDPYWTDLMTTCTGCGVFTSVSGSAPSRIFNLEWRATYQGGVGTANFELRLYEDQPRFDVVFGTLTSGRTDANSGVQRDPLTYTTYFCFGTGNPPTGLVSYTYPGCGVPPTVTATPTNAPTGTATVPPTQSPTGTLTPTQSPTGTPTRPPTGTLTPTPPPTQTPGGPSATPNPSPTSSPTATVCLAQFEDVPAGSPFYPFIRCLACRGIVGGYACGGPGEPCPGTYFRPNNAVTRGQVSKIVAEAAGFTDPIPSTQQTFEDIPLGGTFWLWVERLSSRGILGGYPCGGAFEPCIGPGNRPYFRPNNNVTRGQLSKIVSGAAGWTETPTAQTFEDVPPTGTFYLWVERVAARGIVNGYPCGGAGEPCVAPGNRPYFRPNANATRGQMSKIAAAAFFPGCATPARR